MNLQIVLNHKCWPGMGRVFGISAIWRHYWNFHWLMPKRIDDFKRVLKNA